MFEVVMLLIGIYLVLVSIDMKIKITKIQEAINKKDEPVVKTTARKSTPKKVEDKPEKRPVKKPRAKAKGVQPIAELIKRHKYA